MQMNSSDLKGRELVVALPRNGLHLDLLEQNLDHIDLVLYRDEHMRAKIERRFAQSASLGREVKLGSTQNNLFQVRQQNHAYYDHVRQFFQSLSIRKLILFLHTEPLEQCILSLGLPAEKIEIWEEGLMTYCNFNSAFYSASRRVLQRINGFYIPSILRPAISAEQYVNRDRFREGSLQFQAPQGSPQMRNEILFIGQPIVQDRLKKLKAYVEALNRLAEISPLNIRYLAHPREDAETLAEMQTSLKGNVSVQSASAGILAHNAEYVYPLYLSIFSTALLDIHQFDRSYWLPFLFGFQQIGKKLQAASDLPVTTLESFSELKTIFETLKM
jgi:hypothetical protein